MQRDVSGLKYSMNLFTSGKVMHIIAYVLSWPSDLTRKLFQDIWHCCSQLFIYELLAFSSLLKTIFGLKMFEKGTEFEMVFSGVVSFYIIKWHTWALLQDTFLYSSLLILLNRFKLWTNWYFILVWNVNNYPSSMKHWGSNSWPLGHESPPITTRLGLPT